MAKFRNKMEKLFGNLGASIYDHPIIALILMLLVISVFVVQLPKTTVDTSTEGFLRTDDTDLINYNEFRDQFGRDEMLIVALKPKDVFSAEFLQTLKEIHEELEETVPYIEDLTSLINARNTRGEGDNLIVEDFLEKWPENNRDIEILRERAISNPMYRNLLVSEKADFTTLVLQTQTYKSSETESDLDFIDEQVEDGFEEENADLEYFSDIENSEVMVAVESVLKKYESEDLEIFVSGSPYIAYQLKTSMLRDMRKFMSICLITISVFLYIMFRRLSGIIMPLIIVILSLISTIGFMAFTGTPLKLPTQILPSFLLAVGVGDSVHILVIFFHHYKTSRNKRDSIIYSMEHSGLAILMTSLTTAGGLLSFSTAGVAPVADLGIFAAFGVLLALVYTIVILPALISLFPMKPGKQEIEANEKFSMINSVLNFSGRISTTHPKKVMLVAAIIIALSVMGIFKVRFMHNVLTWFPEDSSLRVSTKTIDTEMKGSISLEIVVDTGKKDGLYDPEILNKLEKSEKYIESLEHKEVKVGKAWSVTTIIKEINKALHEGRDSHYKIPQDRAVVANEFWLFGNSGSDDLEDVVDTHYSKARIAVKINFEDAMSYGPFIKKIKTHFDEEYPEAKIVLSGMMMLLFKTLTSAILSMAKSYIYALSIISVLMVILIGRLRIGLLSMIPNLTPIICMLGFMGWMGIPMDLFSMLVGSIAIGLAVDDTVHFMHNFRRYYEESGDSVKAVMETLHTTGRAMLVTTCVLSIGFFMFMLAGMNNLFNFGMLTGITIVLALLSDYFIAPALMVLACGATEQNEIYEDVKNVQSAEV